MVHRFMVNVDDDLAAFLQKSSKKNHQSISGLIQELINEALDLREDYYLSQLAEESERKCKNKPLISSEEIWRKCDLK